MIRTHSQEERASTPIISNRSPPREQSESVGNFPLLYAGESGNLGDKSSGSYEKNRYSNHNSEDTLGGNNGNNCQSIGDKPNSISANAPKFSCPDEEPIILHRSRIDSFQKECVNNEKSGEIETIGRRRRGKAGGRHRNHRRRPLFSLSSWKFLLLFPTTNARKRSQKPSKSNLASIVQTFGNNVEQEEENSDGLVVSSSINNRSLHDITDKNLFCRLVYNFFHSALPINILHRIRTTGPSFFLHTALNGNFKAPNLYQSKSLVASKSQQLHLQRQRRRRSAQRRRERPVCISGLPNQGQTCFLNSVLQSLASLEPFLEYLEGIVQFQEEMEHVATSASLSSESNDGSCDTSRYRSLLFSYNTKAQAHSSVSTPTFTKQLLDLLKGINSVEESIEDDEEESNGTLLIDGGNELAPTGFQSFFGQRMWSRRRRRRRRKKLEPKALLRRIAKSNKQFSTDGMHEQQDAQELFASLMEVVIHDSELDASPSDGRLEAVSDDGYETTILSLSDLLIQLGNERNRFVDESNGDSLSLIMANKSFDILTEQHYDYLEEKKKELNEFMGSELTNTASSRRSKNEPQGEKKWCRTSNRLPSNFPQTNFRYGKKAMRSTMSPITPSPLSGWLGSTLRCSKCKHVRPIQNAPFLDIPLVPTSVPNYLSKAYGSTAKPVSPNLSHIPSCSLEDCFENFTRVERVKDVECQSCTIRQEIANLEEEALMLQGAVGTTERRRNKRMGGSNKRTSELEPFEQTKCLRDDLIKVEKRLFRLKTMDPDDDSVDPSLAPFVSEVDNMILFDSSDHDENISIQRFEAKKCLLLTRSPSILCCHVQRRYYDPFTNRMEKCVQFVEFPLILDLSPYCAYGQKSITPWAAGSCMKDVRTNERRPPWNKRNNSTARLPYRLRSVIEHRGNAYGGHYVAYRRDHTGAWFCISDSRVTPVTWENVQNCQAYMLFYEAL